MKLAPISSIAQELVRFDLQQLENPEISGLNTSKAHFMWLRDPRIFAEQMG
jgi:hypothetical protein